jgi:hypothetical protein
VPHEVIASVEGQEPIERMCARRHEREQKNAMTVSLGSARAAASVAVCDSSEEWS